MAGIVREQIAEILKQDIAVSIKFRILKLYFT